MRTAALLAGGLLWLGVVGCETDTAGADEESTPASETRTGTSQQAMKPSAGAHDEEPPGGDEGQRLDPGDVPPVDSTLELDASEWRERLSEEEFEILREEETEPRGSGELLHNDDQGIYHCAACGAPLFSSRHKYDSKTGWPSFYKPYEPGRVDSKRDRSMGMTRTEVHCDRCESHLGHVFDDGPPPTGKRYCINSLALDFKTAEPMADETGADDEETNASDSASDGEDDPTDE